MCPVDTVYILEYIEETIYIVPNLTIFTLAYRYNIEQNRCIFGLFFKAML